MIGSGVGFSRSTSEKQTSIFARFVLGAFAGKSKLVSKAARYSTTRIFGLVSSPKVPPLRLPYLRRSGAHLLPEPVSRYSTTASVVYCFQVGDPPNRQELVVLKVDGYH